MVLFIKLFSDLNDVVHYCFGIDLIPEFQSKIEIFKQTYRSLNLKETPKAHALFSHVPQFLSSKNKGLGWYGEHGFESVHAKFKNHFSNFKRAEGHPEYEEKLLEAVKSFNSFNLS